MAHSVAGLARAARGQRFHELTPEGDRVLQWAHSTLDNWGSLAAPARRSIAIEANDDAHQDTTDDGRGSVISA